MGALGSWGLGSKSLPPPLQMPDLNTVLAQGKGNVEPDLESGMRWQRGSRAEGREEYKHLVFFWWHLLKGTFVAQSILPFSSQLQQHSQLKPLQCQTHPLQVKWSTSL